MAWERSECLKALPPYLFLEIVQARQAAIAAGRDVINFGIGDPDRPTFPFIREVMHKAIEDPANHRYPFDEGAPAFRKAAARFMKARYGVDVDADRQVITSIGAKEILAHFPIGVVNPGQIVLVPRPGYPVYNSASIFVGAKPYYMDMTGETGWLPDLDAIPADVLDRTRLIYVNYPNNPTGATATLDWYGKLVAWAAERKIIVCSDAAYNEVYYEEAPPSILQVPGAMDLAVELHSLSKSFNMTGWRIGWVAGNEDLISALAATKSNIDSGQFTAIQVAGIAALEGYQRREVVDQRKLYWQRRDALCEGLEKLGFEVSPPGATFYVWGRCPDGVDSMTFAKRCLAEADLVFIPGIGFGPTGRDYFRAALTVEVQRIAEAMGRLARIQW